MQVTKIAGNIIDLKTEEGKIIQIEKSILIEDSYSADHFETEIVCNMTELTEVLNNAKDTIF